jgi:hypothetical protein
MILGRKKSNRELNAAPGVRYEELPQNVGRARIRNRLAQRARGDYLLFLDGDSGLIRPDFLSIYLAHAHPDRVCCGGTEYAPLPPRDPNLWLHWHYGKTREARSVAERRQHPWEGFTSNNFLVPRSIHLQYPFEEELREYGHEDTLYGLRLQEMEIPVDHIDNPVAHLGLEESGVFLEKQRKALENLHTLKQSGYPVHTRLLEQVDWLEGLGLSLLVRKLLRPILPALKRYLRSGKPALRALDLYKLGAYLDLTAKS